MISVEALILAIEKRPCIWHSACEEYTKKELREQAWKEVAMECYPDWETADDREVKYSEMKKKWVNIRDYYRKHQLVYQTKGRRQYMYGSLLAFMDPIIHPPKITNVYQSEEGNGFALEEVEILMDEKNDGGNKRTCNNTFQSTPKKSKKRFSNIQDIGRSTSNANEKTITSHFNEQDPDVLFLLSFLPEIKNMSPREKLDFKIGMMDVLKKIIYSNKDLATLES